MNWMKSVLAILGSGIASSFTDWFFMGDLPEATRKEAPQAPAYFMLLASWIARHVAN
jgi:hypothetical protein